MLLNISQLHRETQQKRRCWGYRYFARFEPSASLRHAYCRPEKGQIALEGSADKLLDEQALSALYESPIRLIDHPVPAKTAASKKVAVVCE